MRTGLSRTWALLFALLLSACGDFGTLPVLDRPVGGDVLMSGDCVPNSEGIYVCPPISGGGVGGECDLYHYDCGGDDCLSSAITSDEMGLQGCPGGGGSGAGGGAIGDGAGPGGGGGGGGLVPPSCPDYDPSCDSESPPDSCATSDPVVNDAVVQSAFTQLWNNSNPDAPQGERLEQAAWIVQTPNGLQIVPWTDATFGPCTITPNIGTFTIPPNAVGWIHTHPFRTGEFQTSCEPIRYDASGAPVHGTYSSFPNPDDIRLSGLINASLGRDIPSYTMDQRVIIRFVASSTTTVEAISQYGRCGY